MSREKTKKEEEIEKEQLEEAEKACGFVQIVF